MFGHNEDDQQNNQPDQSMDPSFDSSAVVAEPPVSSTPPDTASMADDMTTPSAPAVPHQNDDKDDVVTSLPNANIHENYSAQASDAGGSDLIDLKQKALQELSPLVGHLEQTPEEKFHTTMMMIQATDNKDMLSKAYEAAQAITDEKAKAQALLDVINEINYFTQNG